MAAETERTKYFFDSISSHDRSGVVNLVFFVVIDHRYLQVGLQQNK